tara:strand:+ start:1846 stop:2385 length:540 start_codon:yes stop_codon:yes gene_type:complete
MNSKQITEDLYCIDSFFSDSNFRRAFEEFTPYYNSWVFNKSEGDSDHHPVIGYLDKISSHSIGENLQFLDLGTIAKYSCQKILKQNLTLKRVNTNIQFFGQESSLHVDGPDNFWSLVIFMSPFWSSEWGGEFVMNDQTIPYISNRAVLFKAHLMHKGYAPNRYCVHPRLSLAFLFSPSK